MITFPKLLLLIGIGVLVWFFLRKAKIIGGSRAGAPRATSQKSEASIEDMVKCPRCGSYVPAKGGHDCRIA